MQFNVMPRTHDEKKLRMLRVCIYGEPQNSDNDCTKDIEKIDKKRECLQVHTLFGEVKQSDTKTKWKIFKTCAFITALYACETWTIKKTDATKIKYLHSNEEY